MILETKHETLNQLPVPVTLIVSPDPPLGISRYSGAGYTIALYDLSQKDEEHWQMPFKDIAKELGIQAARSTLQHVFHDQHGLSRRKATYKPFLSSQHIESWLAFCHMALNIAIREFVFTDEMWIEFNSVRRQ